MRTIAKPDESASDVFRLCISRVRNRDLKRRLSSIERSIAEAADAYDQAARLTELHTFPRSADIGVVTRNEIIAVYVGRMVPEKQPGREIYNKLLNAPLNQTCPLCGVGTVNTLDHHLPKTEYTSLVVTPANLIPSCYWCQTSKRENYPTTAGEQTLHPYYDDFTNERWLRATVNEERPASFFFFAEPPANWDHDRQERVRQHMESFKLAKLFASNAGNHLLGIRHGLHELYDAGGSDAVRIHLGEHANSYRAAFRNSWETAMYDAAVSSNWFCDGGFELE
jgi:5-methylcytosine-specific restriction endonuclease McrA